jgi:protein TonB
MKTIQTVVATATTISFDEFIFANRNHAYGAFELRKKYKARLLTALLFTFFILGTSIAIPLIKSYLAEPLVLVPPVINIPVELTPIEKPAVPPPPPPPDIDKSISKSIGHNVPEVVDTITEEYETPMLTEYSYNTESDIHTEYALLPIETEPNDGLEKEDEPIINVQEPAMYDNGSANNFSKWIGNNIHLPEEVTEIGLRGKTYIQFIINRNGELSDLKITRSLHPLLDEELLRVMQNAPKKWTVAKQNGRPVRQLLNLAINVEIN